MGFAEVVGVGGGAFHQGDFGPRTFGSGGGVDADMAAVLAVSGD